MDAVLNTKDNTITIKQELTYINNSSDTLQEILLNDWANSFSDKTTPLGERFSEDFLKRFHFAKDDELGSTTIQSISASSGESMLWERYEGIADIIKISLSTPLYPENQTIINLSYQVKIPDEKFTRYGFYKNGDIILKHWYLVPAVYDKKWQIYSHKNLDDFYAPPVDYQINLTLPITYELTSEFDQSELSSPDKTRKIIRIEGASRNEVNLYLEQENSFYNFKMNGLTLVSNIEDNELMPAMKNVASLRIINFLKDRLGPYPFNKILVSEQDYKSNPVYGLNQLPDIVRPFPDGFQYEIKQLKSITESYLEKTLLINPRYDAWIKDAIHIHLMMAYTDKYYPNMKVIGSLSDIIGIRWFHAADIDFNDQYFLGYKNMARLFLDQPLTQPQDELVKFNQNIANAYKAGIGFKYLEDYLEDDNILADAIRDYYNQNVLKLTNSKKFETILKNGTNKDINWFFDEFVQSSDDIDFTFKSVKKRKDSLEVTIKNKGNNNMPISLSTFRNKALISKTWIKDINGTKKIKIPNDEIDKLVLDYDQLIPEINRRNNYKNLKGLFNKPIQFRFLQDIEDPTRTQIFYIPEFEFNVYDGITIGSKFYNKTFIRRNLSYKVTPSYGFLSKRLIGSASIQYRHKIADYDLFQMRYSFSGSTFSYAPDLLFRRFSPGIDFIWRPEDLRSNESRRLSVRNISVFRDRDLENPVSTPDYSVFNARYRYSDFNLKNVTSYLVDYQLNKNFGKLSTTINYRKLFLNNRQINLRFFAGAFLYNNTEKDGDFFSFALDRPTDYLFDFSYLGRSEDEGLVSQQIILAEGGFKSKLDTPFSNQWLTTFNANTNIWNWIYAYGDVGLVKNKGVSPKFVYDSGIRLSLVADYFELFFPVMSSNGFEMNQPNYNEKIRFIITLSPQTLIGLFTREWY
ncbi:hypothetical protein GCM10022393_14500 [Aquimarina addita]|uniref:Metalloprotease n=1 Tax=Aquimarina addita TaxID=870485 RepID=A0ABP7XFP1_9FLAO